MNMTSFTKPEVHNVLRCRQRKTERPHVINIYRKFREVCNVVFEICERTDRQTDIHTDTLIAVPYFAKYKYRILYYIFRLCNFYVEFRKICE